LTFAIFFTLLTIASAVIPLSPYIWVLYLCAFTIGLGSAVYGSTTTVWTVELGRGTTVPIVQIFELSFGIGSILSTLALKPYLIGEPAVTPTPVSDTVLVLKESDVIDRRSRLMTPTLLIGSCIIVIPIALFVMYFLKPYKEPKLKDEDIYDDNNNTTDEVMDKSSDNGIQLVPKKLFNRKDTPRKTMRLLFALEFALYLVFETTFNKFSVTYFQYSPLKLSAEKATEVYTVAMSVYTAGLVLNILYPYKFQIKNIICVHYILVIVGALLLIPGRTSVPIMWTAMVIMYMGFSAMYSGIIAITEQFVDMTNQLST
ncbi:unnamed protein product, partial [Medioppia subpectinata]